jgi:hypothetical protein
MRIIAHGKPDTLQAEEDLLSNAMATRALVAKRSSIYCTTLRLIKIVKKIKLYSPTRTNDNRANRGSPGSSFSSEKATL